MRGRIAGLLLVLGVLVLMLSAMVVVGAEEDAQKPPMPPYHAVIEAAMPHTPQEAPSARQEAERSDEQDALPTSCTRLSALHAPSRDANGVPVVHRSYTRANFFAFHLSDSAG